MPKTRRRLTSIVLLAAVPVVVFAVVWAMLSVFHGHYADWLTVEAPRAAAAGQPFNLRVTVRRASEPSVLAVSVYVLGWNLVPVGRLPGFHPQNPVHAGDAREFRLDVRPVEKMAYIQFVLWLSPTGDWNARTAGANTAPVPVRAGKPSKGAAEFRALHAFVNDRALDPEGAVLPGRKPPESEPYPASSAPFRGALAALLVLGGAAILLGRARRGRAANAESAAGVPLRSGKERRVWTAVAFLTFLLALSELFLFEGRVAGWGRSLVYRLGVYNFRQSAQKAGLALVAAAVAVLLLLDARTLIRRRDLAPVVLAATAMAVYLALSLAGAMSFHYVDVMRGVGWRGVSLVDGLKALAAVAVLAAGLRARLRAGNPDERKK
ncbi:MAG TPA: hypothetical protein VMS75_08855 [Terriglobales bacterium]|nr:hypothetical protein [Terriglobales bacterium]